MEERIQNNISVLFSDGFFLFSFYPFKEMEMIEEDETFITILTLTLGYILNPSLQLFYFQM